MPTGSNAGGSSGGAPSGAAGGSLTGTYPDPTIASIPSGATATTQAAADSSTKVATTAFATTADNLKANLAGPTFTGVVTLPTGTVATTQSASDNSTKLGTTAYIDTADALKANLASPTFTGTPTLPTGTIATTQSAADSSTKVATTAFTTTADNLKANLASPTFTGTPTLPTGTIATTQTVADSSTAVATTAFVQATAGAIGGWPKIVRRTSTSGNVSSGNTGTTLTNDDTLLWTCVANQVDFVEAFLLFTAANATMDAKFTFTGPSGATGQWGALAGQSANFGGYGLCATASTPVAPIALTGVQQTATINGVSAVALGGLFICGATPGTYNFQWAQNTSDASNLTLNIHSFLRITRFV